jgi:hypothetical protein
MICQAVDEGFEFRVSNGQDQKKDLIGYTVSHSIHDTAIDTLLRTFWLGLRTWSEEKGGDRSLWWIKWAEG